MVLSAESSRPVAAVRLMSSSDRPAVTTLTEDEAMMRDAVARFCQEQLQPHVQEMDKNSKMNPVRSSRILPFPFIERPTCPSLGVVPSVVVGYFGPRE